jgi:hypothetical protein
MESLRIDSLFLAFICSSLPLPISQASPDPYHVSLCGRGRGWPIAFVGRGNERAAGFRTLLIDGRKPGRS